MFVRPAAVEDCEVIASYNEKLALETENIHLNPETIRKGVAAVLSDTSKGRYFCAIEGDQVIGALLTTWEWSDWRNSMFVWLQSVYVAKIHRGKGVFKALFEYVKSKAEEDGCCGIRLYMDIHNDQARRTYSKMGLHQGDYVVLETKDALR